MCKRLEEYEWRRDKREVFLTLVKRVKETKAVNRPGIPVTRVAVKAEGRSYADLLRAMKSTINKEDTGGDPVCKEGTKRGTAVDSQSREGCRRNKEGNRQQSGRGHSEGVGEKD